MSDPLVWTVLATACAVGAAANVALLVYTMARCSALDRRHAEEIRWRDERTRINDERYRLAEQRREEESRVRLRWAWDAPKDGRAQEETSA